MNKEWVLTQEAFDQLLLWLDPDRSRAGKRYEEIRRRLIKIFTCRGCHEAEDLADETINRVTLKVAEIATTYVGDPALYFYGVAQKVHLEYVRKRPVSATIPVPSNSSDELEPEFKCLEQCMEMLSKNQCELVLEYYQEDKRAKINHRKELAEKMGIALNALRIRAHRIRTILQECVKNCMEQNVAG